jgi:hypothetical protein
MRLVKAIAALTRDYHRKRHPSDTNLEAPYV